MAAVGDSVCIEGFPMDYFCIFRGFLFDNPSVETLKGPGQHSVHCLIDVDECITSPFEILAAPGSNGTLHTRAYRLDANTKDKVVAVAKKAGVCGDCDGSGTIRSGLRVVVQGKVVKLAAGDIPPILSGNVTLAKPGSPVCRAGTPSRFPTRTPTRPRPTRPITTKPPTKSPIFQCKKGCGARNPDGYYMYRVNSNGVCSKRCFATIRYGQRRGFSCKTC
jgi:hypothetical protein